MNIAIPTPHTLTRPRSAVRTRRAGLFIVFVAFELVAWIIARRGIRLDPATWLLLALAASFGGRAVAYMAIGEWIRCALTKVVTHSSGAGEDVEPLYSDGWLAALSALVACPICAGAWTGLVLLLLYAYLPVVGRTMIYLFSAGAAAWLVTRLTELLEAATWTLREINGYWHKRNLNP